MDSRNHLATPFWKSEIIESEHNSQYIIAHFSFAARNATASCQRVISLIRRKSIFKNYVKWILIITCHITKSHRHEMSGFIGFGSSNSLSNALNETNSALQVIIFSENTFDRVWLNSRMWAESFRWLSSHWRKETRRQRQRRYKRSVLFPKTFPVRSILDLFILYTWSLLNYYRWLSTECPQIVDHTLSKIMFR